MGRKLVNLIGRRFDRLLVLEYLGRKHHSSKWLCRCDCGEEITVQAVALRAGTTKSCGCFRRERMGNLTLSHGERSGAKRLNGSPEYKAWDSMRQRCRNPLNKSYRRYGGRGIKVCARWNEFENFLADMGHRPSSKHSVERENVNGDYSPGNCKWATVIEQARNRSNNRAAAGFSTLAEAAEKATIPYKTVKNRLAHGWSLDDALSRPVNIRKRDAARHTRKARDA